ncbi:MAG: acetate/propionate family kinase [Acetobacteraceae bacterium]
MQGPIVVINAGSSSIKFSGYAVMDKQEPALLLKGQIEGIGTMPHLVAKNANCGIITEKTWPRGDKSDHEALLGYLVEWMHTHFGGEKPVAVGHRVVHGGTRYAEATLLDDAVLNHLQSLCPLAPLHQPHNLAAIRAIVAVAPSLPQVACFDTAFHRDQPEVAQRFGLPRDLHDSGIRRYGFHGLSYDYIASALRERDARLAHGRVVVAHLGSGASLCAMGDGKSIETTMGFTALDGLPMGTRCGALDPGVILYLQRERGMSIDGIEKLLYQQSGLLGVSGISNDVRELLASRDPRAEQAIDLFVHRIVRELGALVATLGGLDGLVFTAGIGEHAPAIRRRVCEKSAWLGLILDTIANEQGAERISAEASRVSIWAIPTDEERTIARQTIKVLQMRGVDRFPGQGSPLRGHYQEKRS